MLSSCEEVAVPGASASGNSGNVLLTFTATNADTRTATTDLARYFSKLNVQVFDAAGNKVFTTMKTQQADDSGFGSLGVQLAPGSYTVVAVGHSSIRSATIKSPEMVQFTASDGEKLTDSFCYAGQVTVSDASASAHHDALMQRASAMVQFHFTDTNVPASFVRMLIAYTGGSANVNPSTLEGTTKSTQNESRQRSDDGIYQVFTFPYMAATGALKMTLTAYDADGNQLRQRIFDDVSVTRNRITTYEGQFFDGTEGRFIHTAFGFNVDGEWSGEDRFEF